MYNIIFVLLHNFITCLLETSEWYALFLLSTELNSLAGRERVGCGFGSVREECTSLSQSQNTEGWPASVLTFEQTSTVSFGFAINEGRGNF